MKQEIHKIQFSSFYFEEDKKLLHHVWTNENEEMNTTEYKEIMSYYLTVFDDCDIRLKLVDTRFIGYTITPDLQDWINEVIIPVLEKHIHKMAFLVPEDLFEKIAIEQVINDFKDDSNMKVKYFDNESKARTWLLE